MNTGAAHIETRIVFQIVLHNPTDVPFVLNALRGAATDWACCSDESGPLVELHDQIKEQALAAGLPVTR